MNRRKIEKKFCGGLDASVRRLFISLIKGYRHLSALMPGKCRYYPTCSAYALQRFRFEPIHHALLGSLLRILRCNQLFAGGIDYPLIRYRPPSALEIFYLREGTIIKIEYWLVPEQKAGRYRLIKDIDATTLRLPA